MNYNDAVRNTWRHGGAAPSGTLALMKELVRYATLAPSGHNTQCWKFRIGDDDIGILPDFSRRTPVVDPDDHHLYVSLGCAAENLVQAARAYGFAVDVQFSDGGVGGVRCQLERASPEESGLFRAIAHRQCTRAEFDGRALDVRELEQLRDAGTGSGIELALLTERRAMEALLDCALQGNTMQVADPAFVRELEHWIRFSDSEAVRSGDGLSARTTGNPSVPRWLGRLLFRTMFRAKPENDRLARQVRSSAGIAVFVSQVDDPAHWLEAGRCYQRFALQGTALGIRNAFVNQPVEVSALRPELAGLLGLSGWRPHLVVRFGRGPEMPRSLRRPVEEVLL